MTGLHYHESLSSSVLTLLMWRSPLSLRELLCSSMQTGPLGWGDGEKVFRKDYCGAVFHISNVSRSSTATQTGGPTLWHALEDVQKAHEQVFDLVPVEFVAAQHSAAQSRRTLVLERQREGGKTNRRYEVCVIMRRRRSCSKSRTSER